MPSPRILVAALLLALPSQAPVQQPPQQPPTFKSGTQVVEVDVRVFDKNGHFVTDLRPEDFEVTEDGKPQTIQSLTLVGAERPEPVPAAPTAPAAPAPAAASAPRQTWIFLFDTMHLSPGGLRNTREAVAHFVDETLKPGDIAGVIADGTMINNRLTTSREELKAAVESIKLPGDVAKLQLQMTREWPRIQDEYEAWRIAERQDNDALQRAVTRACSDDPDMCRSVPPDAMVMNKCKNVMTMFQTASRATMRVVEALSNGLARMPGPKSVVFVTEGFLVQDLESQVQQATGMANRAGAHLYTIDARGLNKSTASSAIIDQRLAWDPAGATNHVEMNEDGPNALAVDTGGFVIRNENNFGRALDTIQRDAGTYYVLAYAPTNQTFDGKYRKISVNVTRGDVKVRARRGYLALEPAKMLVPRTITPPHAVPEGAGKDDHAASAGSKDPAYDSKKTENPAAKPQPGDEPAPTFAKGEVRTDAGNPAADALRSHIESGNIVQELRKAENAVAADAAAEGWDAYQKGDVERAETFLTQAAAAPDAHAWVSYALGLSQLALGKYTDATTSWERVRRQAPEFADVYYNLADAYLLQKKDDEALDVLRDAQRRFPQDEEACNAIGVIQVRRGALDSAIDEFEKATKISPADSLGYFNLGRAYQMRSLKSQRYDRVMQKWIGGEKDRKRAIENLEKYVKMGGPYVQQAQDAIAMLNWK
ncbi:MAG TPA: VWA domain-containing protein [Vicinamibacterales bacterium]|nr:VWA domain-containing protein [Vicinamibacterales bacterium]